MEGSQAISGRTKLVGLIGSPVAHSQSPKIHNASFSRLGIDAVYLAFDVPAERVPAVASALAAMGVAGYNVTMPCKQAVIACLDRVSDAARLIGAVNTVSVRDGETFGDNTDGRGFWRNCSEHGFDVAGKRVVVMGAGGAASAIFVEAALEGAAWISVFNRPGVRFDDALARASALSNETDVPIDVLDWNDGEALQRACRSCDILVNASKVGMKPLDDMMPVPESCLHDGMVVADIVYDPLETRLLCTARRRGLATVGGLGMLLWQGALAEEVWFPGVRMDVPFVREVLMGNSLTPMPPDVR